MAARIYADVPGNKCLCKGSFSKRVPHPFDEEVKIPVCDSCSKHPWLYVIDADGEDITGKKIRVKIRNDQDSRRLKTINQVMGTLDKVIEEMRDGRFDIRKYESSSTREAFLFKNYVVDYLKHQDRRLLRAEITPKGLKDKVGLIKRELLPFFGESDLSKINENTIRLFRDQYVKKLRTRDLATTELKALLNQAIKDGMLATLPAFDKIPRAKKRKSVITMDMVRKTIALMHKQIYRDMYSLLAIYPIRPGELRCLKWKDIDWENDMITVERHFSDDKEIDGRKSIADIEKARMELPLTDAARVILRKYWNKQVVSLNRKEEFIFINRYGNLVDDDSFAASWRNARKKAGHTCQAYEIRHARLSEISEKTGGNIPAMLRLSGHRSAVTLMEHYVRDRSDLRSILS